MGAATRGAATRPERRWWADRGWPVLTGTLSATGLLAASHTWGPAGVLVTSAALGIFLAIMLYGVLCEAGFGPGRAARTGSVAALGAVALAGLLQVAPLAGSAATACVVLTSPWVVDPTRRRLVAVRRRGSRPGPAAGGGRRLDQRQVDDAFAQLVADLDDDQP